MERRARPPCGSPDGGHRVGLYRSSSLAFRHPASFEAGWFQCAGRQSGLAESIGRSDGFRGSGSGAGETGIQAHRRDEHPGFADFSRGPFGRWPGGPLLRAVPRRLAQVPRAFDARHASPRNLACDQRIRHAFRVEGPLPRSAFAGLRLLACFWLLGVCGRSGHGTRGGRGGRRGLSLGLRRVDAADDRHLL